MLRVALGHPGGPARWPRPTFFKTQTHAVQRRPQAADAHLQFQFAAHLLQRGVGSFSDEPAQPRSSDLVQRRLASGVAWQRADDPQLAPPLLQTTQPGLAHVKLISDLTGLLPRVARRQNPLTQIDRISFHADISLMPAQATARN